MDEKEVKIYTGKPGRPKGVKVLGASGSKTGTKVYNDQLKQEREAKEKQDGS